MWTGTFHSLKSRLSYSYSTLARLSIRRLNSADGQAIAKQTKPSQTSNIKRVLFSTSSELSTEYCAASGLLPPEQYEKSKRVWLPKRENAQDDDCNASVEDNGSEIDMKKPFFWKRSVDETDFSSMRGVIDRIGAQEREGGRMRERKLGVLREDPKEDMRLLIENYTVPALASALRDREDVLQLCATLLSEHKIDELSMILRPFERKYVERRRLSKTNLDLTKGFDSANIQQVRKGLNRMPRRVSQAHSRRAGVVLPLCNVNGVPCVLFEKRSAQLRAHADEVCLPGGMVSAASDKSIVATCLREMNEEIEGIGEATVLGVLRCNWGEVHHLVGVGEYFVCKLSSDKIHIASTLFFPWLTHLVCFHDAQL